MKRKWVGLIVGGCGILGSLTLAAWANGKEHEQDEEKLTMEQLPPRVKEAVQKLVGTDPIEEIEKEREHGIVVYEVEWTVNGKGREAEFTADGDLLELEEEVNADEVPAAVKQAAAKALGKTLAVKFERKTIILYEAEAKVDGKEREVLVFPTGKLVPHEKHGEHEEHGDDHDDDHDDDDD